MTNILRVFMSAVLIFTVLISFELHAQDQSPKQLDIIWHEGSLGNLLSDLGEQYTKETGVFVNVDLVSWDKWHDAIAVDFISESGKYDLVVFDSQSMSEFASEFDIVQLNSYLEKSKALKITDYDTESINKYSEYPEGSSDYYALPLNQDTMGLVYRKDLFEDASEKENFKNKYGYDLAAPQTYDQLKDIAEFFTRPDDNLYGIALFGSSDYDAVTSAFNNVLWSFGGELWDAKTNTAEGVINSENAVTALEFYKSLFAFAPPGATFWYYNELNDAIKNGKVAMGINWYYFFNSYLDPKDNDVSDKIAFAVLPGHKGADGKLNQYNSVGGQGISISKFSDNKDGAWAFLEWLMSEKVQWQWVNGGGQTGRTDILSSSKYKESTPFNAIFPVSMSRVKDYWHLVEYPRLLAVYQENTHKAVTGEITPKEALDITAKAQQKILDQTRQHGYINVKDVASNLPPGEDGLVTDNRIVERKDSGARVFRVNKEVPKHYHIKSDVYLYVISGEASFLLSDNEQKIVKEGDFIFFKKGTVHGVDKIIKKPFSALAIDVPARDPSDVVFIEDKGDQLIETPQ
ncbi:MAG: ABC transporter substrate-binding protein [Thermodesulfobacteriota bacterium]|nr:MAG: ABC transporter substrate-binding protein [Thermodesulfobacteriota bacterium]